MNRLTGKNENGYYVVTNEDTEKAIQRLGIFEDAYEDLMTDREQIPKSLEGMRIQGKEKTVRYKETMVQKLINNNIVMFFEKYDLK